MFAVFLFLTKLTSTRLSARTGAYNRTAKFLYHRD